MEEDKDGEPNDSNNPPPACQDDEGPLKGKKHEFKFVYDSKSKRSRRLIICKYNDCEKEFVKTWNFVEHYKLHMAGTIIKCDHCDKEFSSKSEFSIHMKGHEEKYLAEKQTHQ